MTIKDEYQRVPLSLIRVDRDKRQRRVVKVDDLADSVRQHGVLSPIIITKEYVLVAGERRLEASREAGLQDIPCRFLEELNPIEAQLIELEENLKRSDLPWQDDARAISQIHKLYMDLEPSWNQNQTAKALGVHPALVSQTLRVARELHNPRISGQPHRQAAYNMLTRADDRRMGDILSDIVSAGDKIMAPPEGEVISGSPIGSDPAADPQIPAESEAILEADFLQWGPTYSGQPFNLIHCDFPFGANLWGGKKSGRDQYQTYSDTPADYYKLLDCLCGNLDRLMSHSAHLVFWFSMEFYTDTLDFLRTHAPSLEVSPFPLVWHKTDNLGLLPDPKRGPRRVYETALVASREDRFIVRAVSNAYGAPTDKLYHPSTKPEPVLRHFFQMFVDDNTRLLDPTCGSGSALRAAESLGAKVVLGLELDPIHAASGRQALRKFRTLRSVSK